MISGRALCGALLLLLWCEGRARADTGTIVLRPVTTPKVKARYRERAVTSIDEALSAQKGVTLAAEDAEFAASGNECVADPGCLATMGRVMGADRVVGVLLLPQGADYTLVLILAEVETATILAKQAVPIAHKKLDKQPGAALLEFLAAAPAAPTEPAAPPLVPARPAPVAQPEPRPPLAAPPSPEPGILPMSETEPEAQTAQQSPPSSPSPAGMALGMHTGGYFPRGDIVGGMVVGLDVRVAPPGLSWLSLLGGFDWVLVHQQDAPLVGPPTYPRSRATLIQKSHVYALYAGAEVTVLQAGPVEFYGGAAFGIALSRSELDAYGRTQAENDASPVAQVEVGGRTTLGPLRVSLEASLRETRHDLNQAGTFGEDNLSGLLVTAQVAYLL
jgi:hypothetical protein